MSNKKIIFLLAVPILVIIICTSLYLVIYKPKIVLRGDSEIKVKLGEKYEDEGYEANFLFKKITDDVKTEDNINYDEIGEYEIEYQVKYMGKTNTVTRKIKIVDDTDPVITLKGNEEVSVCPGQKYKEEGYEAKDNYDGDISNLVEITEGKDEITYKVLDSSDNIGKITRKINYKDETKPEIKLAGGSNINVYVGTKYTERGFEATDNCDGKITGSVKKTGSVDTSKTGSYKITYTVSDKAGNETTVLRIVKVIKKDTSGKGKVIYLTFDDGPSNTITAKLLDILKDEGVKATFFVINHSSSLDHLIKREYNEGHTVALHSYTHNYKTIYASETAYFNDLNKIREKVYKLTGNYSNIIRFPGGSSNTVSRFNPKIMTKLTQKVEEKGYQYFDWNVGSGDAGDAKTATQVYNNVIKGLGSKSNIILMHDFENNNKTLNAIRDIIHYGKNHGYTFERITDSTTPSHHRINN